MDNNQIISSGRANLLRDPETQDKIDDAFLMIRTRYDQKMRSANWLNRIWLLIMMRKEMRAELEKIAPSRGCYIKK